MSKPETPCLPTCGCLCGHSSENHRGECWGSSGGVFCACKSFVHAPAHVPCPNAPKAEAPPKDEEDYLRGSRIPIADVRRIAPPAPVSEPPIEPYVDPRSRAAADGLIAKLTAERDALKAQNAALTERVQAAERDSSASMELYRSAVARRDDAETKVATLTAERDKAREDLHQITLGSHARVCSQIACSSAIIRADSGSRNCASGHPPRWVDVAELDALTAEVERLRDLIVKHAVTSGLIAEANAIRAIRAAREAGRA